MFTVGVTDGSATIGHYGSAQPTAWFAFSFCLATHPLHPNCEHYRLTSRGWRRNTLRYAILHPPSSILKNHRVLSHATLRKQELLSSAGAGIGQGVIGLGALFSRQKGPHRRQQRIGRLGYGRLEPHRRPPRRQQRTIQDRPIRL